MKKLNNRAFTTIEVLLSFLFVMIILLNMFSIIMTYTERAEQESTRSQYITLKAMVTKDVQTDILKLGLEEVVWVDNPVATCGEGILNCVTLKFADGTEKNFFAYYPQTEEGVRNKYIQYGDQKYRIPDEIPPADQIASGESALSYQKVDVNAGRLYHVEEVGGKHIYSMHIDIIREDFDDDFGIHIVAVV